MKKALAFFVALCMFLSLCTGVLTPLKSVRAAASWYVDPQGTDDASHGTGAGTDAFKTIRFAVDDSRVAAGDTINVATGTYAGDVVISKQLNLIGAGAGATFITGSGTGVVVTIAASGVTLNGFALTGAGPNPLTCAGIGLSGVTGCMVSQNAVVSCINGIALMHASSNTVSGNTITGSGCYGIYVGTDTAPSTDNVIQTNTITGSHRDGIYVDKDCNGQHIVDNTVSGTVGDSTFGSPEANGLYFWMSSNHIVTGNTISGNAMPASYVGYGIEMRGSSGNTITGNTITGNYDGLHIRNIKEDENPGYSIRNNIIHQNKIYDNTRVNLYADPNFAFDVTNNWWGSADGAVIVSKIASYTETPGLVQPGTHVFIDYAPWYANEGLTDFGPVMRTSGGVNTGYTTIQTALDAAADGDVITVAAGSYAGATITKSVTLRGANTGTAGKDPGRAGESIITSVLNISGQNNTVVIDGFEFTAADYAVMYGNTLGYWTDVTFENNLFSGAGPIYTDTGVNTWRNVTVTRNKFVGSPKNAVQLYIHGAGVVTDNDFENVGMSTESSAVVAMGLASLTVTGNTFTDIGFNALQLIGMTAGSLLVTNNSINGTGYEAIKLGGPIPSGIVSGNTVINAAAASRSVSGEEDRGAIRLRGVTLPYSVTIENNVLQGSFTGIGVKPGEDLTGAAIVIQHNTIIGNTYGVYNTGTTGTLDVRNNWWGSVNGPVAGTNVQQVAGSAVYFPWSMNGTDYAGFTAALSLVPSSGTVRYANGDAFDMTVHFDVAGINVNALDTTITYDLAHLTVTGVDWATGNPFVQEVEKSINTAAGTVTIAAGQASAMSGPFAASGDVAIIHFKTLAATGSTTIAFDTTKTSVMMPNSENINNPVNVLTGVTNADAVINEIQITASGAHATFSAPNPQTVVYDDAATFTVTPEAGYYLASVDRGTFTYSSGTYTWMIPHVTASTAVTATLLPLNDVYVATTGSDTANDGHDPLFPMQTIGQGITHVASAGMVHAAAGTYTEHVAIAKPLTLSGADETTTIIDGSSSGIVVSVTANNVTVTGFTVRNSGTEATDAGIVLGSMAGSGVTGCAITHNTLTTSVKGIAVLFGSTNTIASNTLAANGPWSILLVGSTGNTIASNMISNNQLEGIALDNPSALGEAVTTPGSTGNFIRTNTITNMAQDEAIFLGENCNANSVTDNIIDGAKIGIHIWKSSGQTVTGNTIQRCDHYQNDGYSAVGIRLRNAQNNTITGNTVTNNMKAFEIVAQNEPYCTGNTIHGNDISLNVSGIDASQNGNYVVDATYNWWGVESGPLDNKTLDPGVPAYNNLSGLGNSVTSYVDYKPFWMDAAKTKDSTITVTVTISNGSISLSAPVTVQFGNTLTLTATPVPFYYVYSTTRNGVTTALSVADRMLGAPQILTFANIASTLADNRTTTVAVNIFRRGDIAGNAGGPDTAVDTQDLSVLISEWRTSGTYQLADLNCSGSVDIKDLSMMMSLWQSVH